MLYERERLRRLGHTEAHDGESEAENLLTPGKVSLTQAQSSRVIGLIIGAVSPGKITLTQGMAQRTGGGPSHARALPYASEMEAAFGQSFATVTTELASAQADTLGAQAMTQGEHIAFASAAPSKELVAHELAHVVQQRAGRVPSGGAAIDPDPLLEREADAVAAQVARGGHAQALPAPAMTPRAADSTHIFRKPDVTKTIKWASAKDGKLLSGGDGTNANLVFRVDFGDGPLIVKLYQAGSPSKETAAARLVSALEVPGVKAPNMRVLTDEGELDACYAALKEIAKKDVPRLSVAVMDFMEGDDFGKKEGLIDPNEKRGLERIKNTGSLLAFHHMVKAVDRFAEPKSMGMPSDGNASNIRYAKTGTAVQAIDTTLVDAQVYSFRKANARSEIDKQKHRVGAHIDEVILQATGSELVTTLAKQLQLDPRSEEVQEAIREGFLEGLDAIGTAEVDFKQLLVDLGPARSDLLKEPNANNPAYADYLAGMQVFFREKTELAKAANAAEQSQPDALELARAANEAALGRAPQNRGVVERCKNLKDGKHGTWPQALTDLRAGKDGLDKSSDHADMLEVLRAVSPAFTAVMQQDDNKVVDDFCRIAAKVIDRVTGWLKLKPRNETEISGGKGEDLSLLQLKASGMPIPAMDPIQTANRGLRGPSSALPQARAIQQSFGHHDISQVTAFLDDDARAASRALGARAFATGSSVAFAGAPDLHTAAHEAAHVIQQRGGIQLSNGIGQAGDEYERHADAVADLVVRGESAEPLLDWMTGSSGRLMRKRRRA